MNKNHKTLELDLILEKLAAECSCDDAKDLARGLKPAGDMAEVEMLFAANRGRNFHFLPASAVRHFRVLKM